MHDLECVGLNHRDNACDAYHWHTGGKVTIRVAECGDAVVYCGDEPVLHLVDVDSIRLEAEYEGTLEQEPSGDANALLFRVDAPPSMEGKYNQPT